NCQADQAQTIIPHNAAFQTEDLDTYDSDCDDLSTAQAVLMADISNYGSDIISDVPNSETYLNDMDNQSVHEKANKEQNNESITAALERYKESVKTFEQRLNIDLSSREKMIDSQMDDMIREKLTLKEQIDLLKQNLSKQIKEKESVLQTFIVFKNESKEKENKYMENEIDLEKKIKELDNIICKAGQSAQIVHMLTKPQAFYDNTHKQALELSAEQAFWFHTLNPTIDPSYTPPVIVDVPSELPKVSLMNGSLKKLKFHLTQFDSVVKKRTIPSALKEENTKEENVDHDKCEFEPINKELENSVAKLLSENERLCNEINHVKQKNNLRNSKGKEIVENVVHWKRISKKRTKNRAKTDKTEHGMEEHGKAKVVQGCTLGILDSDDSKTCTGIVSAHELSGKCCDLKGILRSRDTNLYTISLDDMLKSSLICLLSKASKIKSWLWLRRLSHLNFGTLNKLAKDGLARGIPRLKFQKDYLCSACALGKSKKSSHQPKAEDTNQEKLYLLHMDLCGLMRVASINEKSSFESTVRNVQTYNGTEFFNQTLREWYENVGISHQTSVARTPQQNGFTLFLYPYDLEDMGLFDAKADIGIFIGYAPAKKAFRIYNRRTRIITETIHVTFDELTVMASEQFSSGSRLHYMTPATSSTRLVPNPFKKLLRAEVLADSPVSTSIDQDAPSTSIPSSQEQEHSSIISQGFEESPKTPTFHDDPPNESPNDNSPSHGSSFTVRQLHTPLEHIGRWTKDHPIANVIGDPSRSVSTRKQLETDAMWCYYDSYGCILGTQKLKPGYECLRVELLDEPTLEEPFFDFGICVLGPFLLKISFHLTLLEFNTVGSHFII
ncbi:retrovirus-related pol polyprotein from transposon TNT 1-94, partial [Tanacetum coccineum]